MDRGPSVGERSPAGDDAFDRLQRAAEKDRRGDDGASRDIAGDGQQRAKAERGGLDEHAEELAGGRETASNQLSADHIGESDPPAVPTTGHSTLGHAEPA